MYQISEISEAWRDNKENVFNCARLRILIIPATVGFTRTDLTVLNYVI
jgi:hypothetical protein